MRLLALLALVATPALAVEPLLIKDARIVDPDQGTVRRGSILIREGRIERITRHAPKGFQGQVLEASGRWLIPGLVDAHAHTWGNPSPRQDLSQDLGTFGAARHALYAGVTSVLDLFYPEDAILALRDAQRARRLAPAAEIFAAGAMITCTGGHGTEYPGVEARIADSPAQARQHVEELALRKADVVKIVYDHGGRFPTIDHGTMEAAVREATRFGLKSVVHIGTWDDARDAVLAGASVITHLHGSELPEDLVALMRERGTLVVPTLTILMELANLIDRPALLDAPLLGELASAEVLEAYRTVDATNPFIAGWTGWQRQNRAAFAAALGKLHRAGVPLATGTDSGNLGVFQGWSVHREMALLVELGLTPWEALKAATTTPARFLGKRAGFRPGAEASFVLLSASPIDDIANSERIDAVILKGSVVDRAALLAPTGPN